MSLKGIELQIALPKTFEAGKIAEQKHQQSQLAQDFASDLVEREEKRKKERVLESEQSAAVRDEDKNKKREGDREQREKKEQAKQQKVKHPYKGSFFDVSS